LVTDEAAAAAAAAVAALNEAASEAHNDNDMKSQSKTALQSTNEILSAKSFDQDLYVDDSHEDNISLINSDVVDNKDDELKEGNVLLSNTDNEISAALQVKVNVISSTSYRRLMTSVTF
jgi:hypothetical protein